MDDRGASARNATIVRGTSPSAFRLEQLGFVFLVALGVTLRFRQYLFNRSFWLDEASLALNVADRNVITLLTEPLANLQSAPPGFLVAARSIAVALGPFDWALRLVPLIAGVSVVLLSVLLARRELTSTVARLAFVGFIALSPVLIFYSSEFKQYSSDALAAVAILVAFSYRSSPYGTWLLAGTGFAALFCSLPAVFVAAPAALCLLYEAARSHRYRQLLLVGLGWLAGAALHGAYILQAGTHYEFMVGWWREHGGFPPSPVSSVADFMWYPRALSGFVYMAFSTPAVAVPNLNPPLSDPAGLGLAGAFAVALALSFGRRRPTRLIAAAAIVLTVLASSFEIYPFSSRLVLFLVPLAFFTIAAAIDAVDVKLGRLAASLCALPLFGVMAPVGLDFLVEPRAPLAPKFKDALRVVEQKSIDGDALALEPWSGRVFAFYSRSHAPKLPAFMVEEGETAPLMLERARSAGYRRVWYLETSPVDPSSARLIEEVGDKAPIVFTWRRLGTRLVVFDFAAKTQ